MTAGGGELFPTVRSVGGLLPWDVLAQVTDGRGLDDRERKSCCQVSGGAGLLARYGRLDLVERWRDDVTRAATSAPPRDGTPHPRRHPPASGPASPPRGWTAPPHE